MPWYHTLGWRGNPFDYRPSADFFVFRDFATDVFKYVDSGAVVSTYGIAGMGKTSLLHHVSSNLDRRRHVPVFLDFREISTKDEFLTVLRRRMSAEGGLLGRIRSIVGGRDGAVVDSISSAIGKRQLVLLIDEAGLLKDEEVASLLATIKDRCSSAIVSTSIEPLSSYRVYKGSFREGRVARELQFPLPRHSELGEMVKERIEGMGGRNIYPFTSEAVEYISRISGSIPREVLINCQNAAIYYADEKFDRELTRADLEILMTGKSAPGEGEENLERVFANLSENQQKIIQSLVRPKTAHELEKELKISYGSLTKELGRLMLQTDTDMMGRKGLANPVCTKTDARPFKFVLTKKWRLLFTKE